MEGGDKGWGGERAAAQGCIKNTKTNKQTRVTTSRAVSRDWGGVLHFWTYFKVWKWGGVERGREVKYALGSTVSGSSPQKAEVG